MDTQKEKDALIEMFVIHFEKLYNLPPLGARILGILILDSCNTGITFESLVERLDASKSSVSTNLNLLLKLGKINYYNISGDRKKYFKAAPLSERLDNYLQTLEFEKKIIEMMLSYREKTASCPAEKCSLENTKAYKSHILEVEQLLLKTISKFKEIEKNK
ncbi:GbsR/MarR family transcriptional regulator [Flavobacterium sp. 3HN19-14]|uniref:GbsR/MarR family transcriptional regulator n=1 Tax=Flavobacterium sp. 3HN19-14 TaxID=3448133 RepID=UPI003EE2BF0B